MSDTMTSTCLCGKDRTLDSLGYLVCENCDRVQPQEAERGRVATTQDYRFKLETGKQIREWYP